MNNVIEIEQDLSAEDWDRELASLGGHPWQSALWGNARRNSQAVVDHRWLLRRGGKTVQMVRFEERRIAGVGKIAWAPRGPVGEPLGRQRIAQELRDCLREHGFTLVASNPWQACYSGQRGSGADKSCGRTIWIDLSVGRQQLWCNLEQRVRYGVNRSKRDKVRIQTVRNGPMLTAFFALCQKVSDTKKFELRTTEALMHALLNADSADHVEARLFIATCDGALAAGAFILRCGRSVHYLWGATDRSFSRSCGGAALQWAVMDWALSRNCDRYDLEGIDPIGNPGTYAFKKKLGGDEVLLVGRMLEPISLTGHILAPVANLALQSRLTFPGWLRNGRPLSRRPQQRSDADQVLSCPIPARRH